MNLSNEAKAIIVIAATGWFLAGVALADSAKLHIKESNKRKRIDKAVHNLANLKKTDTYKEASEADRQKLINKLIDEDLGIKID